MPSSRRDDVPKGAFRLSITGCARCHGKGHDDLLWLALDYPVELCDVVLTHWTPCPFNGQPILLTGGVDEEPG